MPGNHPEESIHHKNWYKPLPKLGIDIKIISKAKWQQINCFMNNYLRFFPYPTFYSPCPGGHFVGPTRWHPGPPHLTAPQSFQQRPLTWPKQSRLLPANSCQRLHFPVRPTQRQARKLISGPGLATKARLLSFNGTQSRVDTGLLTRHNTLRMHLYVVVLSSNPTRRKCGTEEETSVHILCECEALASLRHSYMGSFFLDPEDIMNLSIGATWNFGKGRALL
jgi:hypothetical protein